MRAPRESISRDRKGEKIGFPGGIIVFSKNTIFRKRYYNHNYGRHNKRNQVSENNRLLHKKGRHETES